MRYDRHQSIIEEALDNVQESESSHFAMTYEQGVEEAFIAYKNYKEMVIKQVAEKYKEQIDPRAYTALLNYEVNIND